MSNSTKYFLIPASSGLCIQPGWNKTETAPVKGDDSQLWQIEQGKKNKIAFRNVDSGDYLRAAGGYKSNAVQAGARQWWTLETSDTPHAFWIKCDEYPNAYLCNSYGNIKANNTIYMWAKEDTWTQTMLWYFFDYDSWSKHRSSKPDLNVIGPTSNGQKNDSELAQKLEAAENKQHELEQKLRSAEEKQQELESKAKDKEDRAEESQKDFESREEAISTKEKELDAREKALAQKQAERGGGEDQGDKDTEEQVAKLRKQVSDLQSVTEQTKQENDRIKVQETELSKLRRAYEDLKRSQANGSSSTTGAIPSSANSRSMDGATVGRRGEPPGLRTREPRPNTSKSRLAPIQLQQGFSHLPRLRS